MPLILRSSKDSALSFAEMDGNLTYLDTRLTFLVDSHGNRNDSADILQIAQIDSASISATAKLAVDSAHVKGFIDAAYVQSVQSTKDSAFITSIIDSNYIEARADRSIGNLTTLNVDNIRGVSNISSPHSDTPKVFTVTVAAKDTTHRYEGLGSASGYKIDGVFAPFITLTPGRTYQFDTSDNSNQNHPIHFYFKSDKSTGEYTTGVTQNGVAGQPGSYTQIQVGDDTPEVLHYQCFNHAYMGNSIAASTRNLAGYNTDDLVQGTQNEYYTDLKVKNILGAVDVAIVPDVDNQRDLGSSVRKFRDLYLSGSTLHLGNLKLKDSGGLSVTDVSGNQVVVNNALDSSKVTGIIDAAYVQARQTTYGNSDVETLVDSAYVALRTGTALDSATTISIINSTVDANYVQLRETIYGNAEVTSLVDAAYVQARQTTYGNAEVTSLVDSAYINARAEGKVDSNAVIALINLTVDSNHVHINQNRNFSFLINTPTTIAGYGITDAFGGNYDSLTNKPSLFDGQYSSLTGKPSLFDGQYSSLTGSPTIPSTLSDLTMPSGTNGQVLTTDGSGNFTFTTVSGGGGPSTDTLADVTARGATTTDAVTFSGGITVTDGISTDSISNTGIGFGKLKSASDIQLDAAGDINALNNKIINLGTPVGTLDATNKSYVDTAAQNKGSSDFIIARIPAQQYTTTTETDMGLSFVRANSPNLNWTLNPTSIATDLAGYYEIEFQGVLYAYASAITSLQVKAEKISGGSSSQIQGARIVTSNLYNSAVGQNYEYHTVFMKGYVQLAANDGVSVSFRQFGGSNTENYFDDADVTSGFPGYTTLTVKRIG